MELKENKIEFDLEELAPLLIANKTEGFRQIGEKILNAKWLDRKYVSWDNLVQSEEAEEEFTENF